MVHRIAHLVADCGVAGAQCLAITFTRRAAAEMRERLHAMLGPDAGGIAVHTFHSLGLAMLREHADAAGLTPGFRVAGEAERAAALAAALGLPRPRAENLIRAISKAERSEALPNGEIAAARTAYRAMLGGQRLDRFRRSGRLGGAAPRGQCRDRGALSRPVPLRLRR